VFVQWEGMKRRMIGASPAAVWALGAAAAVACNAAGGDERQLVGTQGTGGVGGGLGTGGSPSLRPDGGASENFGAHFEQAGSTVTNITVCAGECTVVVAVATGGRAPYTFVWDGGATGATREICPTEDGTYEVAVTDSGVSGEVPRPAETVHASLAVDVVECPDGGSGGSGGTGGGTGGTGGAGGDGGVVSCSTVGTQLHWAQWTSINIGSPGTADGVFVAPGHASITVNYSGELLSWSALAGGGKVFVPERAYLGPTVANAPGDGGMLAVQGAAGITQVIRFSRPVCDPVLAVWSFGFGAIGEKMEWEFDAEPELLQSQGSDPTMAGGLGIAGRRLWGIEGSGMVEFKGVFTAIRFTVPVPEPLIGYGGFTLGLRTQQ
jgi:hypothetical protein